MFDSSSKISVLLRSFRYQAVFDTSFTNATMRSHRSSFSARLLRSSAKDRPVRRSSTADAGTDDARSTTSQPLA